jgi:uncharacterized protein (PEP-CTERM system associated)
MRRLRAVAILGIGRPAVLLGIIAWLGCGAAARAQVLPPTGVDTRVGDLRGYFEQAFGQVVPPEAATHGWTWTAAVDASETYDTGVSVTSHGNSVQGHDLITRISPSGGVSGDSARLAGSLFYAPTINIYTFHGNQNGIDQNLNGAVTATVVPDLFFVDLRAYAAEQAINGFNGPSGTTDVSSSNEALTTSFSVAPTLRHTFSSWATAELGYELSRTSYNANNNVPAATAQAVNQNVTTEQEHATVSTGDNFGRFNDVVSAQASQSSGTRALQGASSEVFSNTLSYAVTRTLVVNAEIGHEDISYGGDDPYKINDVTWNGGLVWTPSPDTSVSLGYGHQQGGSSFNLDATYATSADTRVYARYSQGVGTNAQNLQNAVNTSTVNASGITIDRTTGMPIQTTNNFFPLQPGVFRTTSGSVSGVLLWPRDLFNVGLQYQSTTQLTNGVSVNIPGTSSSTTGTYGSFTWTHDLSDSLHTNFLVQYGVSTGTIGNNTSQSSILVNVGLNYDITDTLSSSVQATYTTQPTGIDGETGTSNEAREIVIVSVHKTF